MDSLGEMLPPSAAWPDFATMRLRYTLIREETIELDQAITQGSIPEIMDGLADLIYVALGMAISCGVDLRPIWVAVHRANMTW